MVTSTIIGYTIKSDGVGDHKDGVVGRSIVVADEEFLSYIKDRARDVAYVTVASNFTGSTYTYTEGESGNLFAEKIALGIYTPDELIHLNNAAMLDAFRDKMNEVYNYSLPPFEIENATYDFAEADEDGYAMVLGTVKEISFRIDGENDAVETFRKVVEAVVEVME